MQAKLYRWQQFSLTAAWGLVVVLLPITSLPLVARLTGADSVAAASALPLFWLVLIWFVPYLVCGGRLPGVSLPFLALVTAILISSFAAYFLLIPPFRDKIVLNRELTQLLTLGVGAAFYLVSASWPVSERRLQLTLQLINIGGALLVAWSLLQAYYWFVPGYMPQGMRSIQDFFSVGGVYYQRVNGFAYEPSWLGHQLNMLYIPFWLAATVQRTSAHRFRLLGISIENLLLLLGVMVLFWSISRVGYLSFILVLAYLIFQAVRFLARKIAARILLRFPAQKSRWAFQAGVSLLLLVSFFGAFAAGTYGVLRVASRYDHRLGALFMPVDPTIDVYHYTNNLRFAERLVFWATGWNTFNRYPILGVGIGNAGYYFQEDMPAFGWQLTEVNRDIYQDNAIPNTKSLWARLLAETGFIGFAIFITWLYVLWQAGRALRASRQALLKTVGLAGTLALIALLAEGFSVDSYAMPYLWFSMGILSAASSVLCKQSLVTAGEKPIRSFTGERK